MLSGLNGGIVVIQKTFENLTSKLKVADIVHVVISMGSGNH